QETPLADPHRAALAALHRQGCRLELEQSGRRTPVGPYTAAVSEGRLWAGSVCVQSRSDLPACRALLTGDSGDALGKRVGEMTRTGYVFYGDTRALDVLQAYRSLESGGQVGLGVGFYGPLERVGSSDLESARDRLEPLRIACREQLEPALLEGRLAASCLGYVLQVLAQPVAGRTAQQRTTAFLQALDTVAREHADRTGDRWFLTVKALEAYGEVARLVGTGEPSAVREGPDYVIIGAVRVPRRG
ncbi:MAG: hypothetical protein AB1758_29315, partial [Candidatus Eremiobacterota bacterium]